MKTNLHPNASGKANSFLYLRYLIVIAFFACMSSASFGQGLIEYEMLYGDHPIQALQIYYNNNTNVSCYGCSDGEIDIYNPSLHADSARWFNDPSQALLFAMYYEYYGTTDGFTGTVIGVGASMTGLSAGHYYAVIGHDYLLYVGDWEVTDPFYFEMDGNTGLSDSDFIGNIDSVDFSIRTANLERIRILKTGNTGIGTSTPTEKLDVAGNARIRGNISSDSLAGSGQNLVFADSVGVLHIINPGVLDTIRCDNFTDNWYTDYCHHPNDIFNSPSSGKVGIGTTTPTQKLHVAHNDSTGTSAGMILENLSGYNKNSEIKFNQNGTPLWAIGNDVTHSNKQNFFIYDNVAGATRFYIDSLGKVFIGFGTLPCTSCTSSSYKLYVDSGIATRDVKVTAGAYPDYVFHKDYKPMSLKALEKYIAANKHLPDVPTEEEVEKNGGFEVGALEQSLLKKVEEQTLYIIALQKQMDEMKKRLDTLNK